MTSIEPERTYHVPDISCVHCQAAIEREVRDLPGVFDVTVDVTAKRVRVRGAVSEEAVRGAIERAGYRLAG